LAALVGPVKNIFFPIIHNFYLSVPIVQQAGLTGRQGPQSLYACLWLLQSAQYKILFSLSYTFSISLSPSSSKLGWPSDRATRVSGATSLSMRAVHLLREGGTGWGEVRLRKFFEGLSALWNRYYFFGSGSDF
jgi:hypothetical protein